MKLITVLALVGAVSATLEAHLNPLCDFGPRAQRALTRTLDAYHTAAAQWHGRLAYSSKRKALCREAVAQLTTLAEMQLSAVCDDVFATFQSDLIVLMAQAANYKRAATALRRRTIRRFDRAAKTAALPSLKEQGFDRAAIDPLDRLRREHTEALSARLRDEVAAHEEEAMELPPREQDVGPPPWWKQLAAQVLSMVLNVVQAYFLQYLPQRRRDLADERAMPRGPLF